MASELLLVGLVIPEQYGGAGLGAIELGIVMEEMGRCCSADRISQPRLAAMSVRDAATKPQNRNCCPAIASGKTIATLAFVEEHRPMGARMRSRCARRATARDGASTA